MRLQVLLAYLVLHRAAPQSRQHLAFLLWPDSPERKARSSLRTLYHHLRRALPDANRFLTSDAASIQWKPDSPFTFDILEFEQAAQRARTIQDCQATVRLYPGDLLPGAYFDWVLSERERLHQLYCTALEKLVCLLEDGEDGPAAIAVAERLVNADPLREETYRILMRLHSTMGDRVGMVRTYAKCRDVLSKELDVEPSPETRQTYEHALRGSVAPPSTTTVAPTPRRLSQPLTSFVGREREKARVQELVIAHRLVTLTGEGGAGKTRLALAAIDGLMDAFPQGVWWVDLASIADPSLVAPEVAAALGLRVGREQPLLQTLADYVQGKHALLVLDNGGHLVAAVGRLAEQLVSLAPDLHLLITSRERLRLGGETTWRVPPLRVPDAGLEEHIPRTARTDSDAAARLVHSLYQYDSVRLFVDRAAAMLPTFELTIDNAAQVAGICRRLDGIPLAIELAAGRVRVLSLAEIAERLENRFHLLTGGSRSAPLRHQTLQGTLDWSYSLLSEKERILLRRLAVFTAGFTLQAAEAVCAGDGIERESVLDLLSGLQDKSLVVVDLEGGAARNRLLETIAAYAKDKLAEADEVASLYARHLEYYAHWAAKGDAESQSQGQGAWLKRLSQEMPNLRAAMDWSIQSKAHRLLGLSLAAEMSDYWVLWERLDEGRVRLLRLLENAPDAPPSLRARAFTAAGLLTLSYGNLAEAQSLAGQGLALARELQDGRLVAESLFRVGIVDHAAGEYGAAAAALQEAEGLFRRQANRSSLAVALQELGDVAFERGDPSTAHALVDESREICRELGERFLYSRATWFLALMATAEGDYALARSLLLEMLGIVEQEGGAAGVLHAILAFGYLAAAEGCFEQAARLLGAAARIRESIAYPLVREERKRHDQVEARAREGLGDAAFRAAWDAGAALDLAQAIAYARVESGALSPLFPPLA